MRPVVDDTGLFVGREPELADLAECARRARSGQPSVAVIEGGAGVGKTALIRQWLDTEAITSLRAFGDASESDLAFGVVGQLLGRMPRERVEQFPLLRDGIPPAGASSVQVGGQLLGLLDDLQTSGPVMLIVEDVHWVDQASLQTLGFVLRRLEADQILTVLTTRSPVTDEVRKLTADRRSTLHLVLTGLGDRMVAELVRRTTGKQPGARVVRRLREHTGGNPLYLRTLLAEIPTDLLHGDQLPEGGESWPVPTSLAAAVHRQLDALPAPSRGLVGAAAVLDTRTPLHVVGRLAGVSDPAAALQPALAANLMRWWPSEPTTPVMITHALQRDAVIEAITPPCRRRLHHHAADLVDEAAGWRHKVAAVDGPDDHLSRQLEDATQAYLADGATERAATLLLWASDLATTRSERERLLLTAAVRLLWATQVAPVQHLLPRIRACSPAPLRSVALGTYAMLCGALQEAAKELTAAFEATADDPAEQWTAAVAGISLACTHLFTKNIEGLLRVARQVPALNHQDPVIDYVAKSHIIDGRSYLEGPWEGLQELERLAPLPQAPLVTAANAWLLTYRGFTRVLCGLPTAGREDLRQVLPLSEGGLSQGLDELAGSYLTLACYWTGAWDDATVHADLAIMTATDDRRVYAYTPAYSYAAWVPAGRGDTPRARELLHTAEQHALPFNADVAHLGWAIEAQARADWPAMRRAVEHILTTPTACIREVLWKPLQVEALLRTGDLNQAAVTLSELAAMTATYPTLGVAAAWLSGELAHARGDLPAACAHYEHGIALPATPDDHALHRAFLEHAYGRHLAATGRTAQARIWLENARNRYQAIRALPFLDRCQSDIAAAQPTMALTMTEFTGREHDIAHLVAQGMTNKEIAGRLFISGKTVEYHLGHIYTKLNLANRRQLRDYVRRQTPVNPLNGGDRAV